VKRRTFFSLTVGAGLTPFLPTAYVPHFEVIKPYDYPLVDYGLRYTIPMAKLDDLNARTTVGFIKCLVELDKENRPFVSFLQALDSGKKR